MLFRHAATLLRHYFTPCRYFHTMLSMLLMLPAATPPALRFSLLLLLLMRYGCRCRRSLRRFLLLLQR